LRKKEILEAIWLVGIVCLWLTALDVPLVDIAFAAVGVSVCYQVEEPISMSIQIYNDGLSGAGASGASRTQEVSTPHSGHRTSSSHSSGGDDQVQISSLSSSLAAHGSERASRVAQLAAAYQSGKYEVNSMDVSKAMVNHALQAGSTEGES
jgi:anti-sigma28 factor (negative regulator of flagellin synthesis)